MRGRRERAGRRPGRRRRALSAALGVLAMVGAVAPAGCAGATAGRRQIAGPANAPTAAPPTAPALGGPVTATCGFRRPPRWLPLAGEREATLSLTSGGHRRSALIVLPAGFDARRGQPWPLLVDFHGHGSSAPLAASTHGFGPLLAAAGVVAVYPQGLPQQDGLTGWSSGAADRDVPGVDDVAFTMDLLARLGEDLCLDGERTWVVGHSNGGGMVGVLACSAASRFDGFVAIAGAFYARTEPCRPDGPVRLLEVHGDADAVVPYDGSERFPSLPAWLAGWADRLACDAIPTGTRWSGPPAGVRLTWRCPANSGLSHLRIIGGDHAVPDGAARLALAWLSGS